MIHRILRLFGIRNEIVLVEKSSMQLLGRTGSDPVLFVDDVQVPPNTWRMQTHMAGRLVIDIMYVDQPNKIFRHCFKNYQCWATKKDI